MKGGIVMASVTKGNCYLCGAEIGKAAIKNHLLKKHDCEAGQLCAVLKAEGAYDKYNEPRISDKKMVASKLDCG